MKSKRKLAFTTVIAAAMAVLLSVAASAATVVPRKEYTVITAEVRNGKVEVVPVSSDSVRVGYDRDYHEVLLEEVNGEWKAQIRGRLDFMDEAPIVTLYVPDSGCKFNIDMDSGSFLYHLPPECPDAVNIVAKDAEITFLSESQYKDSTISITGEEKDYMKYSSLRYPDFFTESGNRVTYQNGTGTNSIHLILSGFSKVDFAQ